MTRLRIVALICMLTVCGACTGGDQSPSDAAHSSFTPIDRGGGTTNTKPFSGSTSSPNGSGGGAPARASTLRPGITVPRAGRYTYEVVEQSRDAAGPTKATYTQEAEIDPPVSNDDGVTIEIRTTRQNSDAVEGEVFLFRRNAIDLLFADGCALDRPAPHYRLPLRAGASWSSPRSCEGTADTGTTRVRPSERLTVDGVTVDAFPVERTATLRGQTRTKTQWYAPAYHLVVRSLIEEQHDGTPHTIDQRLRSLRPA